MTKNNRMDSDLERLVHFMFEVGTLRKVSRSHKQTLMTDDLSDNIASHSFRVAVIGYLLAKKENVDANKVLLMCLVHDISESRSGDQNWVHKKYVKVFDDEILKDQLSDLVEGDELYSIATEYEGRETVESKIAKDADLLDQILLLKEYANNGNEEAKSWLSGREQEKLMHSKTAKAIAKSICSSKVHCWWDNLWTSKRR